MAQGGEVSFDMSKAKRLMNFEPKYSLADAVQSIKNWIDEGGLEKGKVQERIFGDGVKKN